MKKNKIFYLLLLFTIGFLLNFTSVYAETITTQDGMARCVYYGSNSKIFVSVVIRIYKDTTGTVRSYANMRCSENYTIKQDVTQDTMNNCSISNYSDLFYNASTKLYPAFYNEQSKQWQCPSEIYVDDEENNLGVYLESGNGRKKIVKDTSRSSVTQTEGSFDSNDDQEDFSQTTISEYIEKVKDLSSSELDINKIKEYYNKDNTQKYKSDVDSCALISGDVQTLLHDVFLYICIAGIIILIVMTIINLIKVITGADENLLKNFAKSLKTRIICLIILLILPTIVTFAIQVINGQASAFGFNADNPLCGITKKVKE